MQSEIRKAENALEQAADNIEPFSERGHRNFASADGEARQTQAQRTGISAPAQQFWRSWGGDLERKDELAMADDCFGRQVQRAPMHAATGVQFPLADWMPIGCDANDERGACL